MIVEQTKQQPTLDDKYTIVKKVGSGATCKVKLGVVTETNEPIAIKILTNTGSNITSSKHYQAEIEMLKKINHPNIINLRDCNRGVYKKPNGNKKVIDYIVLEYAENGELFDYVYFPRKGFTERVCRVIFRQLIEGLEACHISGVAHRDLKTENIMMNKDWVLKIADFGYATLMAGKMGDGLLHTCLGTLSYAAPEILNRKPYSGACADLFSCGVILFVLVTGKLPFGKAVVFDNYYKNFIKNDYEAFWKMMSPKIEKVSDEFKNLINLLLSFEPSQRPSMSEIKNHPWFAQEVASDIEVIEEFEKRKVIVLQMRKIEAAEELNKKMKKKAGGVYRSIGDDEDIVVSEPLVEGQRQFSLYKEKRVNPYKINVSGIKDCVGVMNVISDFFLGMNEQNNISVDEEYAKMRVSVCEDQEFKDNYPEIQVEQLVIDTEISKFEEGWIVEFNKVSGDKFQFFEIFDQFSNLVKA
jgi:serine/threonine protein kinase